jgi:hypothetical protein
MLVHRCWCLLQNERQKVWQGPEYQIGWQAPEYQIGFTARRNQNHSNGRTARSRHAGVNMLVHTCWCKHACALFADVQDDMFQQVFSQAVEDVYTGKVPLRCEAGGESMMYCYAAARDRETPTEASEFVRDVSSETRGARDVCALLVVSVPQMRVRSPSHSILAHYCASVFSLTVVHVTQFVNGLDQ